MVDSHICILTLLDPFPTHMVFTYMLTIVFSQWPAVFPILNTSAETIAKVALDNWISTYREPSEITFDRGLQFQSTLFQEFVNQLS